MEEFMDFEDDYEGGGEGEWSPSQCEGLWATYFTRHIELVEAFTISQSKSLIFLIKYISINVHTLGFSEN